MHYHFIYNTTLHTSSLVAGKTFSSHSRAPTHENYGNNWEWTYLELFLRVPVKCQYDQQFFIRPQKVHNNPYMSFPDWNVHQKSCVGAFKRHPHKKNTKLTIVIHKSHLDASTRLL